MIHPHVIADEECSLVQPIHIGAKWHRDNLIFRSSVWNSNGEAVSLSLPKFFNWGEQPDIHNHPVTTDNCELIEKIDGSLLAISQYKGVQIVRTRGTVDATKLDNGHEIEVLRAKYPEVFKPLSNRDTADFTLIFEWVSPTNRIVIDYGAEPDLYLTNAVKHADYRLAEQREVDAVAQVLGVKRPRRYKFDTIEEMVAGVETFKGVEGICVYFNGGQTIRKLKGVEYLSRHRFKENATLENTIELYFALGQPEYQEFEEKLIAQFDYECFDMVRGFASNICDAIKEVHTIVESMTERVEPLKLVTRKEAAAVILQAYGDTNRASFCFKLLDNKSLLEDDLKKLLYQVLKK